MAMLKSISCQRLNNFFITNGVILVIFIVSVKVSLVYLRYRTFKIEFENELFQMLKHSCYENEGVYYVVTDKLKGNFPFKICISNINVDLFSPEKRLKMISGGNVVEKQENHAKCEKDSLDGSEISKNKMRGPVIKDNTSTKDENDYEDCVDDEINMRKDKHLPPKMKLKSKAKGYTSDEFFFFPGLRNKQSSKDASTENQNEVPKSGYYQSNYLQKNMPHNKNKIVSLVKKDLTFLRGFSLKLDDTIEVYDLSGKNLYDSIKMGEIIFKINLIAKIRLFGFYKPYNLEDYVFNYNFKLNENDNSKNITYKVTNLKNIDDNINLELLFFGIDSYIPKCFHFEFPDTFCNLNLNGVNYEINIKANKVVDGTFLDDLKIEAKIPDKETKVAFVNIAAFIFSNIKELYFTSSSSKKNCLSTFLDNLFITLPENKPDTCETEIRITGIQSGFLYLEVKLYTKSLKKIVNGNYEILKYLPKYLLINAEENGLIGEIIGFEVSNQGFLNIQFKISSLFILNIIKFLILKEGIIYLSSQMQSIENYKNSYVAYNFKNNCLRVFNEYNSISDIFTFDGNDRQILKYFFNVYEKDESININLDIQLLLSNLKIILDFDFFIETYFGDINCNFFDYDSAMNNIFQIQIKVKKTEFRNEHREILRAIFEVNSKHGILHNMKPFNFYYNFWNLYYFIRNLSNESRFIVKSDDEIKKSLEMTYDDALKKLKYDYVVNNIVVENGNLEIEMQLSRFKYLFFMKNPEICLIGKKQVNGEKVVEFFLNEKLEGESDLKNLSHRVRLLLCSGFLDVLDPTQLSIDCGNLSLCSFYLMVFANIFLFEYESFNKIYSSLDKSYGFFSNTSILLKQRKIENEMVFMDFDDFGFVFVEQEFDYFFNLTTPLRCEINIKDLLKILKLFEKMYKFYKSWYRESKGTNLCGGFNLKELGSEKILQTTEKIGDSCKIKKSFEKRPDESEKEISERERKDESEIRTSSMKIDERDTEHSFDKNNTNSEKKCIGANKFDPKEKSSGDSDQVTDDSNEKSISKEKMKEVMFVYNSDDMLKFSNKIKNLRESGIDYFGIFLKELKVMKKVYDVAVRISFSKDIQKPFLKFVSNFNNLLRIINLEIPNPFFKNSFDIIIEYISDTFDVNINGYLNFNEGGIFHEEEYVGLCGGSKKLFNLFRSPKYKYLYFFELPISSGFGFQNKFMIHVYFKKTIIISVDFDFISIGGRTYIPIYCNICDYWFWFWLRGFSNYFRLFYGEFRIEVVMKPNDVISSYNFDLNLFKFDENCDKLYSLLSGGMSGGIKSHNIVIENDAVFISSFEKFSTENVQRVKELYEWEKSINDLNV